MRQNRLTRILLTATVTAVVIAGCESNDPRLVEFARHATEQQARQNDRIADQSQAVARQSQELASTAHKLVEQDAAARRELIQAQGKLQGQIHAERSSLDRQRQEVDAERKSVAAAAIREPVIAQAIIAAGLILAAMLPLIVTAYAIRRLPDQCESPIDQLLADTLIADLAAEHSGRDRIRLRDSSVPRLGGADLSADDDGAAEGA
jgi:hypothetical protein